MDEKYCISQLLKFNITFYVNHASEIFEYIYESGATTTELIDLFVDKNIITKNTYTNLRKSISSFLNRIKNLTNNDLYKENNVWKINKECISSPQKLCQFIYFVKQRNNLKESKSKKKLGKVKNDSLYNFLIFGPNGKPKDNKMSNNQPSDKIKNLLQKEDEKIKINKIEILVQDFVNEIIIKKNNGFQIKIVI